MVRLAVGHPYDGRRQTHQDGHDTSFPLNYTMIEHCKLGSWLAQTHTIAGETGNHVKLYIRRLRDAAPRVGGYCNLRSFLMTIQEWLASKDTIEKSRRSYAHFDYRTDIGQQRAYISDPRNIEQHGFYPFIHYKQIQIKFNRLTGPIEKVRDICYASHIDRCIYQYYSFLLGGLYNRRVAQDGLSAVAVAYRTDLHQNNIHFAKRAIDFIRNNSPCYVMIGDFTGFFDHLDHKYLKQQWCSLMGVPELPKDHYKVFRSVTRYSTWELSDLLALNHLEDNRAGRRDLNSQLRVLTPEEYKAYSNRSHIKQNPDAFGIPQGSPISGLLANVYMLEVDKAVNDLVTELNGLYMRYSDDFIVVLPDTGSASYQALQGISTQFNKVSGLTLEPHKTQYFRFENKELENCGSQFGVPMEGRKRAINFLGFMFDGKTVSIRPKTVGKYYYRMYSKAKTIKRSGGYSPKGNHISTENLYALYSAKGIRGYWMKQKNGKCRWHSGNFLTYVQRAKGEFGEQESIERDTRHHMAKIRKALKAKK